MDHRQGEEGRKQERVTWIDTVARWLPEEAETVLSLIGTFMGVFHTFMPGLSSHSARGGQSFSNH